MKDNSFITCILGLLIGLFSIAFLSALFSPKVDDQVVIDNFINSRGATPVPSSWAGKIGKGI